MKFSLLLFGASVAFTMSFICSTMVHYGLNRFWALPSIRKDSLRQLKDYFLSSALSYLISFSVFHFFLDVVGLGKLWATTFAVPPSTIAVFLMLNYRVFRESET